MDDMYRGARLGFIQANATAVPALALVAIAADQPLYALIAAVTGVLAFMVWGRDYQFAWTLDVPPLGHDED